MWLDAVALLVLGLFAGLGAARGGLVAGWSLLTLTVSYAAALFAGPRFAAPAAELAGAPDWLGVPIAGSLGFLAAFVALSGIGRVLRRRDAENALDGRSGADRLAGFCFGGLRGALLVLLIAYAASWVEVLRTTGTATEVPEFGRSTAVKVTERVVEAGVQAALGDEPGARLAARFAAAPSRSVPELVRLVESPAIVELRNDPLFWSYVEHGNVDAALNRGAALEMVYDADLRTRMGKLGLIEPDAVDDPMRFREAAAQMLRQLGPRLRGLRDDPALRELMQDPEVMSAVQSGDHLALMRHPGFRAVVARVMER